MSAEIAPTKAKVFSVLQKAALFRLNFIENIVPNAAP